MFEVKDLYRLHVSILIIQILLRSPQERIGANQCNPKLVLELQNLFSYNQIGRLGK